MPENVDTGHVVLGLIAVGTTLLTLLRAVLGDGATIRKQLLVQIKDARARIDVLEGRVDCIQRENRRIQGELGVAEAQLLRLEVTVSHREQEVDALLGELGRPAKYAPQHVHPVRPQ